MKTTAALFVSIVLFVGLGGGCGEEIKVTAVTNQQQDDDSDYSKTVAERTEFFSDRAFGIDATYSSYVLIDLLRAYSGCQTNEEVRHAFEDRSVEFLEKLFLRRKPINEFNENRGSMTAVTMAGEVLLVLGWNCDSPKKLNDKLMARAVAIGLDDSKRLCADKDFQQFIELAWKHKEELEEDWPWGDGEKPEDWNGIQSPKR